MLKKVKQLKAAGATGVIFYQTKEQGERLTPFDLEGLGGAFPCWGNRPPCRRGFVPARQ